MSRTCVIGAIITCLLLGMFTLIQAQETMTLRVDSTTIFNGQLCFAASNWVGNSLMDIGFIISENDTVYFIGHQQPGQPPSVETQILTPNSPPTIGTGWWFDFGEGGIDRAEVVSHTLINVPLGQFDAFTYEYTDSLTGAYSGYMQFSLNTGLIGLMQTSWEDSTPCVLSWDSLVGGNGMFPLEVGNIWIFVPPNGLLSETEKVPIEFTLYPNHPNPFNPSTVLSFELRAASFVRLEVFNGAGSWITTLAEGWKPSGAYEVSFDGAGLPSGVYLARLNARDYTAVQKMVLLK